MLAVHISTLYMLKKDELQRSEYQLRLAFQFSIEWMVEPGNIAIISMLEVGSLVKLATIEEVHSKCDYLYFLENWKPSDQTLWGILNELMDAYGMMLRRNN